MGKPGRVKKFFVIGMEVIVQIFCFYPWIVLAGRRYGSLAYLVRVFASGDVFAAMSGDAEASGMLEGMTSGDINTMLFAFLLQMILLVILQTMSFLYLVLVLFGREVPFLEIGGLVCGVAALITKGMLMGMPFESRFSQVYAAVLLAPMIVEFLGVRAMDAWQSANKEYAKIREREENFRKERKERLAFPGRYTRLFYRVIWRNFQANWKDYLILIVAGMLAAGYLFTGIGTAGLLSPLQANQSLLGVLRGNGIGAILVNFLVISFAVSVFLLISVLLSYLRKRVKNYGIMVNLGIRQKTLYLYMGLEFAGCIFLSIVGGCLLGTLLLQVVRVVLGRSVGAGAKIGHIGGATYGWTIFLTLLVFLIAMVIVHDLYLNTGVAKTKDRAVEPENMPGRFRGWLFGAGILLTVYECLQFTRREHAEGIGTLALLLLGVYLLVKNGWAMLLLAKKKKENVYFTALVKNNFLYHRFKTTFRYTFFLGVVHIAVLFLFSREFISNRTAQEPETMFPYDYMCLASEKDAPLFAELEETYGADITAYPMVRVSNTDNTEMPEDYRNTNLLQGQHIGISASTYRKMCADAGWEAEPLSLAEDGSEVYLIYQQDRSVKAHPIDYCVAPKRPHLRVGQPLQVYGYMERDEKFPRRDVAGEKIGILTGAYRRGDYENIVVFSDTYFEKVKDDWKTTNVLTGDEIGKYGPEEAIEDVNIHAYPNRLVLLNIPEENREAIEEKLRGFQKTHAFDESFDEAVKAYYSTRTQITEIQGERMMHITVNLLIILSLFLISLLIVFLKFAAEVEEKKKRSKFLHCMGMHEKERKAVLKKEVWTFVRIPLAMAAIFVPILTVIMWRLRQYTAADCLNYLQEFTVLAALYLLTHLAAMKCMEIYLIRKVEGKGDVSRQ